MQIAFLMLVAGNATMVNMINLVRQSTSIRITHLPILPPDDGGLYL